MLALLAVVSAPVVALRKESVDRNAEWFSEVMK